MQIKALILGATYALLHSAGVFAQEPASLTYGKVAVIRSEVLKEDRRLNVLFPPGYDAGVEKYPVIYLLDGSAHEDYFHAAGLFDFLATYGVMPPSIVVGISNVERRRDFTMPSSDPADLKSAPTSGGAGKFVSFLEKELIPYVGKNYRVTDRRTLIGQSLAGLLATQVLLEQPQLFTEYVIVDPSLWWNKQALLQSAAAALKEHRAADRKVYLSAAGEPGVMKQTAERLVQLIKDLRPDITCFYEYLPAETHATSLHISLYNAMRLLNKPSR